MYIIGFCLLGLGLIFGFLCTYKLDDYEDHSPKKASYFIGTVGLIMILAGIYTMFAGYCISENRKDKTEQVNVR